AKRSRSDWSVSSRLPVDTVLENFGITGPLPRIAGPAGQHSVVDGVCPSLADRHDMINGRLDRGPRSARVHEIHRALAVVAAVALKPPQCRAGDCQVELCTLGLGAPGVCDREREVEALVAVPVVALIVDLADTVSICVNVVSVAL